MDRRRKEISDVDEEEIQFRSDGRGGSRGGSVAARLGGRGPEDAAELTSEEQSQPGQPADAKPVGAIDLAADTEPVGSVDLAVDATSVGTVDFPADAAADAAFAKQPRLHVEAFDEPEPLDQSAYHSAFAAQYSG